ncbi:MAG: hypothetical protein IIZ23_07180 [Ruminococcus sp.]|nr:hypothetical protein [Ruminococcus sp.]
MNNYEDNKAKHNVYAQAFLDDHKALMEMAELCHKMYETARANEQTYGSRESGVRFAKKNKKTPRKSRLRRSLGALSKEREAWITIESQPPVDCRRTLPIHIIHYRFISTLPT